MNTNEMYVQNRRKRIKYGYLMAIITAVMWGMWYVPGNLLWCLDPFVTMYNDVAATHGDTISLLSVAVLISAGNALMGGLFLFIWNGSLHKLTEMRRTVRELNNVTKYLFMGSMFAGPIAIFGSYLATGLIGASFAAVACLGYPVVGTLLSVSWLGQKISKRAIIGIAVVICGCVSIYAGGLVTDITSGTVQPLGYIGGLMAIFGWGCEGAVAAKAMDVSQSDIGFHIRTLSEVGIWWVIIIPILAIAGFPFLYYIGALFANPLTLFVLLGSGVAFGICNVTWYKSFALLGVGRGQGLGCLNALFAVMFILIFTGTWPTWTVVIGGIICIVGILLMFYEGDENLDSIRGKQEEAT